MLKKRAGKEKVRYSSVSLPIPLIDNIKKTIQGTGYHSVSSFVEDLIRTALTLRKEKEVDKLLGKEKPKGRVSDEMEKRIKERLKSLGYLA